MKSGDMIWVQHLAIVGVLKKYNCTQWGLWAKRFRFNPSKLFYGHSSFDKKSVHVVDTKYRINQSYTFQSHYNFKLTDFVNTNCHQ